MERTLTHYVSVAQVVLTQNVATFENDGLVQLRAMDYEELMRERLRAARAALSKRMPREDGREWSAQLVADEIPGMGRSALSMYENGKRYPGPNVFMALSAFYQEPAAYLAALLVDDAEITIARAYFHANTKDKAHILNAAQIALSPSEEKDSEGQVIIRAEFFESKPEKKAAKKKVKTKTASKRNA